MVFSDLTTPGQNFKSKDKDVELRIAPVSDRFLAFVFDLLIFFPVLSLTLAPLFKKVELLYYQSPTSTEFFVIGGIIFVCSLMILCFYQMFFLKVFMATPGKMLFKMIVVDILKRPLTLQQILTRSVLWEIEFVLLLIPFSEILSHRHRRALHDRASETMVISLKKITDLGPHPLEAHFVRNMLTIFVLSVFVWSLAITNKFYNMSLIGYFKKQELIESKYLCDSVSEMVDNDDQRVDRAISFYLTDQISDECLLSEADFALWTMSESEKSWAYLAKAVVFGYDHEKSTQYLQKVCEVAPNQEPCAITEIIDRNKVNSKFKSTSGKLLSALLYFKQGDVVKAEDGFDSIANEKGIETFVQRHLTKLYWMQNNPKVTEGAYRVSSHLLGVEEKVELSTWLCNQQLEINCTTGENHYCDEMKKQLVQTPPKELQPMTMVALLKDQECKGTETIKNINNSQIRIDDENFFDLLRVLSKENQLGSYEKTRILKKQALNKDNDYLKDVQFVALSKLIETATDKDLLEIAEYLSSIKFKNFEMQKTYSKLLHLSTLKKDSNLIQRVLALKGDLFQLDDDTKKTEVMAYYLLGDLKKSWALMKPLEVVNRQPASEAEYLQIKNQLEKTFGGK